MIKIYAADDEKEIRDLLDMFLRGEGYEVHVFDNGDDLYKTFISEACDLVILDIMMPGNDGLLICDKLRRISKVPIIILSARDADSDYISGLALGSDDYITKPFRPSILVAKIKALLRRVELEKDEKFDFSDKSEDLFYGDLKYIEKQHLLFCEDKEVKLTPTELRFLIYMMKRSEEAVSKENILNHVWGFDADIETRVADETNRRLRKKLAGVNSKVYIQTVWGYGFKMSIKGDYHEN